MKRERALVTFVLITLLFTVAASTLAGCTLNRMGLCTPTTPAIDPSFRGCFENTAAPPLGQITIIQEPCNVLRGTGSGLFKGTTLWSFTGHVSDTGMADLHIQPEDGQIFDVKAYRVAANGLGLVQPGFPDIILTPCP